MHLFWWQQLPLLILIQLLEPNSTGHKLCAEALVACKRTIGSSQHFSGRIGRHPCLRQWASTNCYKLNDPGVVSLSPRRHPLFLQTGIIELSSVAPNFISSNYPSELYDKVYKSSNRRIAAAVDGENAVPMLTPWQPADEKKPSKKRVAAIVGGGGAALLLIVILLLVYVCLMRVKKFLRQASETVSSVPSPPPELARGDISLYAAAQSPFNMQNLRQLSIIELEHATQNFNQNNIIGDGAFGLVYKGLLLDGSIVAIKRCLYKPVLDFVHKVKQMATVHHKHIVELIGYCEDRNQQLLVYDYISNRNVGNYLYDSEGLPIGKLDMRQRLSIALGAAKGDNFAAKVSDYGLLKLVCDGHRTGSSSAIDYFLDPELNLSKNFSEQSDVYSFGVFLLELISGRESNGKYQSGHDLVQEAREFSLSDFIEGTLRECKSEAAVQMGELALLCVDISTNRPSMSRVVREIEKIQKREMGYLQLEFGEEIGSVTLGSELFK